MAIQSYKKLASPMAQLEAANEFGEEVCSRVEEWADEEPPREEPLHWEDDAEDSTNALTMLALAREEGLRFEDIDSEGETAPYFHLKTRNRPHDLVLHDFARSFSKRIAKIIPGWTEDDTMQCLGWEDLVLIPDDEKVVPRALEIWATPPAAVAKRDPRTVIETTHGTATIIEIPKPKPGETAH